MSTLHSLLSLLSIWISYIVALEEDHDTSLSPNDVPPSTESNDTSSNEDPIIFNSTQYDSESIDMDSCEDEDEEWDVEYIGTQFRVYNPCDDDQFLKITMSDLAEYDLNGNRTQEVKGFELINDDEEDEEKDGEEEEEEDDEEDDNGDTNGAAIDNQLNWKWINRKGFNTQYEGYHVVKNTFKASNVLQNADFTLTTFLFKEDAFINNNHTIIPRNALKWNVNITNWPLLNHTNHLELCINLVTNRVNETDSESEEEHESGEQSEHQTTDYPDDEDDDDNDEDDDDDEESEDDEPVVRYWRAGDFDVGVFDTAECGHNETITVTVRDEGIIGSDQRNLCFIFAPCASGNIFYDPIVAHIPSELPNDGQLIASLSRGLLIAVVGAVGCVIVVMSICYIYKKKRRGPYQGLLETELSTAR